MNQKSVNLTLKLTDKNTKKIHAIVEKLISISSDEKAEESVKPFRDFVKGLADEVYKICEQQKLQLSDAESLEQNLLINILLSLAKEELNDISVDIHVSASKSEKVEEEQK